MNTKTPGAEGFIHLDENGRIQKAVGIGLDKRITALVLDPEWISEARRRRLQPLKLDTAQYIFLVTSIEGGDLILIHRSPGDAVLEFIGSVDFAYDVLDHIISNPFEGMTILDKRKRIAYLSPVREKHLGLSRGDAVGRPLRDVIENSNLDRVITSGHAEIGELHRTRDGDLVVSRIPIKRDGNVVGAVGRIMFKDVKQLEEITQKIKSLESQVDFYRRETAMLRDKTYGTENLLGESAPMKKLRDEIIRVAALEVPVLITGENGTGKEIVAHCLHRLSPRRNQPLVMINSAALPSTLVETELFGYEPGAFTGAHKNGRKGKFEQADGGTIFLDEIGDMPIDIQVKMLRVLQDRMVTRVGGEKQTEIDFRLITATNRDLSRAMSENQFRVDLFYRISAFIIEVPPLRKRPDDIPLLARHFLKELAEQHRRPVPELTDSAINYLCEQHWPGNVRQLRQEIARGFVFDEDGKITVDDLRHFTGQARENVEKPPAVRATTIPSDGRSMQNATNELENDLVRNSMALHQGNKKRVADELGISRSYLYKVLGRLSDSDY